MNARNTSCAGNIRKVQNRYYNENCHKEIVSNHTLIGVVLVTETFDTVLSKKKKKNMEKKGVKNTANQKNSILCNEF